MPLSAWHTVIANLDLNGCPPERLKNIKSEEMFGRDKSEEMFGRFGQTFLPFAIHSFACVEL
jgi:hypothetical protein